MWPWEKLFTCVKEAICFRFVCCGTWGETLPRMTKLASQQQIKYRENGIRTHGVLNDILKQLLTHLAAAQFSQTQANE